MKNSKEKLPSDQAQQPPLKEEKSKKKMSKLKILSIIWTALMFCVYIALDASKIVKQGWTAPNIIVTAFLGLQIILFIVFSIIGATTKEEGQRQKTTVKWVKKLKKFTLKLTTVVTSIIFIVSVESASFGDILGLVIAIISLILFLISMIRMIVKQCKKAKKAKQKAEKNAAKNA